MEYLDCCKILFGNFHSHYLLAVLPICVCVMKLAHLLEEVLDDSDEENGKE